MTEDTSPENLRKFLESDDPALVRMGLSMAKGSGVPEELLPAILKLYMWDDDKTIRAAARSVFMKHAPDELKDFIKETWNTSYRTNHLGRALFRSSVLAKVKELVNVGEGAIDTLIKLLNVDSTRFVGVAIAPLAARELGEIGDTRAVDPLIEWLENTHPPHEESRLKYLSWYYTVLNTKFAIEKLGHEVELYNYPNLDWVKDK